MTLHAMGANPQILWLHITITAVNHTVEAVTLDPSETRKPPRQFANKDLGRLRDTDLQQREQLALKSLQLKWLLLICRGNRVSPRTPSAIAQSDQSEMK